MDEKAGKAVSQTTLISNKSNEVSYFQRCLWLLNIVYYQVLAVVTIVLFWVFFKAYDLNSQRLWHLVFATAAYVPLMAAAIILFSEDNLTTLRIPRNRRYVIHGVLLFMSCAAVTVGIALETDAKRKAGRAHFVSIHAILGLTSWILIFVSVLMGLISANTGIFKQFIKPIIAKLVHNFLGLTAFALGIGAVFEMFSVVERNTSASVYQGTRIGLIFVTIWSGLAALKSLYRQIKGVFS